MGCEREREKGAQSQPKWNKMKRVEMNKMNININHECHLTPVQQQ